MHRFGTTRKAKGIPRVVAALATSVAMLASMGLSGSAALAASPTIQDDQSAQAVATGTDVTAHIATYYGQSPKLPAEIDGQKVTWDDSFTQGDTYNDLWSTVTATGTTADGGKATATVDVVTEGVTYFIDAGTGKDWESNASQARKNIVSGTWQAIKALAGDQLLNADSDQFYVAADNDTWGHEQGTRASDKRPSPDQIPFGVTVENGDTVSGKYDMGMTSLDRNNFTYYFTLDAGTYTLTTGIRELYDGNHGRTISQKVTDAKTGAELLTLDDVRLSPRGGNAKAKDAAPVVSSGSFTLKEKTLVKVAFPRGPDVGGQSNENGVISWLAVAKGENPDPILNKAELRTAVKEAKAIQSDGKTYAAHSTAILDAAVSEADKILNDNEGKYNQDQINWQVRMVNAGIETMTVQDLNTSRYSTVQVGDTWLDTEGAAIQAHGGGFLQQTDADGKPIYYWVGEDKTHNSANYNGIALYSSKDLVNWTFRNLILKYNNDIPGLNQNKIERPKLIYNANTKTYVLWGHWEGYDSYASSQIAVATSKTVDGDYEFLGHWRPGADADHRNWRQERGEYFFEDDHRTINPDDLADTATWGTGSRDMTLFVDDDGTAYMISAQDGSRMRIYELNADYTDVAFNADGTPKMTYLMFDGGRREAPALSKIDGKYYIITSGQSGWLPNEARYSYTTNLKDPNGWKLTEDGRSPFAAIGNNSTFYSQPTNIMQVNGSKGTTLVYMGDRWNPSALRDSTYVWLPLTETGNADNPLAMDYQTDWSLNTETGEVVTSGSQLLSQGEGVTTSSSAAVTDKDGFKLEYANDGDWTTYFRGFDEDGSTVTMPFTYTVDLGKVADISRIDLSTRLVNGSETYYQYTIETSLNNTNWTKVVDESDNTTVGFMSHKLTGQARYVRLNVTKVAKQKDNQGAGWASGIQEFQVWGKPSEGGAVTPTAGKDLTAQTYKVAGFDPVNRVQLHWATDPAATSYKVFRSESADMRDPVEAKSFDGAASSWDDNLPAQDKTYYYQVKGYLDGKVVSESVIAKAVTWAKLPEGAKAFDNNTGTGAVDSNDGGIVVDGVRYQYLISGNNDDAAKNGYVVKEQKSTDGGKTWSDSGVVVTQSDATDGALDDYKFEAVSTVYNKAKNKVVIWAHYEKRSGYATGALFEADVTPGKAADTKHYGGLVFPNGYQARDKSVFVDDDNTAYLVTASNLPGEPSNRHIVISKLNADWTAVEPVGDNGYVAKLTASGSREAPALIKADGWYYLFTSANAGWLPSAGGYNSAKTLDGEWSELRQVGEGSSFSTQQNGAAFWQGSAATGATVSGNRWWRSDGTAGWRITPLALSNGYAASEYYRTIYTDATTGQVIPERDGVVLSEGRAATLNGADASATTDGDYQTVTANTDADLAKRWPATWQVDLGESRNLTGIEISSYIMNGSEGWYPYTVYGSNDGTKFDVILDKTGKPAANNKADYGFTAETIAGNYRYVKVVFGAPYTQNNWDKGQQTWYRAQFAEIKVLGTDGLTPPKPDKTALKAEVEADADLRATDYTAATWTPFESALKAAEAVLADDNATAEQVRSALDALVAARKALVRVGDAETQEKLQQQVDEASKLAESDYTPDSWKAFAEALKAAKDMLARGDASAQEIQDASAALADAQSKLVERADKADLQAAVDDANELAESAEDYTSESWAAAATALDEANKVLDDPNTTQDAVDAALNKLNAAIKALVRRPTGGSGSDSGSTGPSVSYLRVQFDSRGGSAVTTRIVEPGTAVDAPAEPTRDGYAFYRWTTDEAGAKPYDFTQPVTSSFTLYAQWRVPVYRLYNPYMTAGSSHLYTTNPVEYEFLKTQGWNQEGVSFLSVGKDATGAKPVWRLYNQYDGSHHYTMNEQEYDYLKTRGWTQEGIGWYAIDPESEFAPLASKDVYRLYNQYTGEHLFTLNEQERDYLPTQGWTYEGVAFKADAVK